VLNDFRVFFLNRKYSKGSPHCKLLLRKRTTKQAIVQQTEEGEDNKNKTVQQPSKRKIRSLSKEAQWGEESWFL